MTHHPKAPTMDLSTLTLGAGAHDTRADGMCVMEAAAYLAGEPHSDHPACVSPVIAAFCRAWNDALPGADRQRLLVPLLPVVIGTRTTPADEETRAWMATDWIARVHTPAWLRLAGLTAHAEALEACARITDAVTAGLAQPTLYAARAASADASAAASFAASAAASFAASAAASAAARAAARAAAWAPAWDAASAAASVAAWAAAWDAARDAASAAASAAASVAARDAARAAAWAPAWDVLAPTVTQLQASAVELVRAMCAIGPQVEGGE